MKRCNKCGITKDESEWYFNPRKRKPFSTYCKDCSRKLDLEYKTHKKNQAKKEQQKKDFYCVLKDMFSY